MLKNGLDGSAVTVMLLTYLDTPKSKIATFTDLYSVQHINILSVKRARRLRSIYILDLCIDKGITV